LYTHADFSRPTAFSTGPWPGLDSFGLAAIQMKPRRFTLAEVRLTAQPLLDPLDRAI
jgi:hypothetical protein